MTGKILAIRKRVLNKRISKSLFQQIDLNKDNSLSKFEYLCYQLVNGQWNVDQADTDQIMSKFHKLDRDGDGSLKLSDVVNDGPGRSLPLDCMQSKKNGMCTDCDFTVATLE